MQYIHHFRAAVAESKDEIRRNIDLTLPRQRSAVASITSAVESLGRRRLSAIRDILENGYVWTRSNTQRKFHEAFLNSVVRFLYSHDASPPDFREIMEENNWVDIRQQCLCMTPRRFGKTMSVGMFCASYLYSVENCEIAIFSTGRRASQKLLELINSLICKLPGGKERIIKYNQEVLNMSNYDGSYGQSKLSSYPSNAKTLRGVGADIVM